MKPMTFNEVEAARERYHQKTRKVWRATFLILLALVGIILVPRIFIILFSSGFTMPRSASPSGAMFALLPFIVYGVVALVFFVAILYAVVYFATAKERAAYYSAYKTYFVEQGLRTAFTDLHYEPNRALSPAVLEATGMVDIGDRFHSNDLIVARYQDVLFTGADVHIETEHTDSDGDTYYTSIFHGRFMIFEFPKKFDFRLELISKGFRAYCVPGRSSDSGRKMVKIDTESSEFNRTFRILGEDGFEAFYLLDPATMVRLEEVANRHTGGVLFGFTDNKLLVALDGVKDSFEPPSASQPLDEATEIAKVRQDIDVITGLIDNLKLSRK